MKAQLPYLAIRMFLNIIERYFDYLSRYEKLVLKGTEVVTLGHF